MSKKDKKPATDGAKCAGEIPVFCAFDEMKSVESITPHPRNPNQHGEDQIALLAKIIEGQGWRAPIVVSARSGFIVAGHARHKAAQRIGVDVVPVNIQEFESEATEMAHLVADNRIAELAEIDDGKLRDLLSDMDTGEIDMDLTGFDHAALEELMTQFKVDDDPIDADPQIDKADELAEKWGTKLGQIWELGEHRVACGDSTSPKIIAGVMGEEKAALLHADPPYGMGKEKDGVANDNLYRDKLDSFQMEWWRACRPHLEDNASAYIWGNAKDLWRLWYVGGLAESERLTFRNCIAWDKYKGSVKPTMIEKMRSFVVYREDCFFFMLGEQGFNNNADNYWEGWEPIRAALAADCEVMGWGAKDIERICGVGMFGHWFTKSQWTLIPEEHYKKLQHAAQDHDAFKRDHDAFKRDHDAFTRDHDNLKREFYATRAYFDNTHDNMTDVWHFDRVTGEERHGHATPKPVAMMCRCIKSSAPAGAVVLEPFIGSGSTLMACQNLGRKCRGIELSPKFVAVTIERWHEATGKTPRLIQ